MAVTNSTEDSVVTVMSINLANGCITHADEKLSVTMSMQSSAPKLSHS